MFVGNVLPLKSLYSGLKREKCMWLDNTFCQITADVPFYGKSTAPHNCYVNETQG